ncbi:TIGR02302 family protein [Nitratireductor sp. ZSWI3]|uniref:TIGR02302 family protein n=1 Tax=Nitratireductor sp. ZSWI3 TaxID=2966359 RepID=UPI00214FAE4D|nr:TIGR02302 family protein [Nitratireductor sp. ZSWI3]MCR4265512.1 TIGR02302 family protein [Nitratireductor sp. ZSWI3]
MAETSEWQRLPKRFARLARMRFVMRGVMVIERLWPLILPLLVIASIFLSLSWFGLFRLMPDSVRFAVLAVLGLGGIAALWPLRSFRRPTPAEVDRRIERSNQLEHEPVSSQSDRLAGRHDGFAAALWREHQKRMADKLGGLHGDLPKTRVPERDPWGLRAAAALFLVIAAAFSTGPLGGSVTDAFRAHGGAEIVPPRIDAWVTPPTYTGRAPIYLTAEANRGTDVFTVPQGSILALRVTGGSGAETLAHRDADGRETVIDPEGASEAETLSTTTAQRFSRVLEDDGEVLLKRNDTEIDGWRFAVTPDLPPQIRLTGDPKRAVNGTLELTYEIEDDYGAARAEALFEPADADRSARPLYEAPEMPLALPRRDGKTISAKTSRDLTEHPWAGTPVELKLTAVDAADQRAVSEPRKLVLPERLFTNPLAKALIEQRRILAMDGNKKPRVLALMDAVLTWPEETLQNMSHFLGVFAARSRLSMAESDDQLRGVVDYLWEIALIIEDGDLTAAEKRLRQAQEALKKALEEGASEEEIARLMDELRSAMQEFLREFAERAQQNPDLAEQMPQDGQMLSQSDLERMLDQIEDLAKSGAHDQARELLSQLENMMNNLQAGRSQRGQGGGEQSEMRRQMDELGNLMRRQQELMNETFRTDRMQRGEGNQGGQQGQNQPGEGQQPGQGQGPGQGMSPQEFADAMRGLQQGQGALRGDLDRLMQGLEGLGIKPGEGFGEAGEAMGQAEGALGEGQGEQAVGEQGRALEALRRGAQDMMNQMQQAMRGEQGGGEQGYRRGNNGRDPLGRPQATTGPDFGDSVQVPDEIDTQRARRILEAIRKRLGDALSPALEKEYLERLLDTE